MAGGALACTGLALMAAAMHVSPELYARLGDITATGLLKSGLGCAGYILGCVLPDCDNPNSMVGRYVCLPVEHRTWTHSVWFLLLFFGFGFLFSPLFGIGLGCMVHLLCDSISKCGVCWFYPMSKYRHYGISGAKIKKGHFLYLYSTEVGEAVICGILWAALAAPACLILVSSLIPALSGLLHLNGVLDGLRAFGSWLAKAF